MSYQERIEAMHNLVDRLDEYQLRYLMAFIPKRFNLETVVPAVDKVV